MIQIYDYKKDKNIKLSDHFKVGEFRSHVSGSLTTNEIKIDTVLINKLEELMKYINASKGVITSAYRNKECDIKVGGTGKGQHVNGRAVDIIFYDKNNKTIDTKYISCIAQDLNFKGIARINDRAIHLDNRTGNKYYGDETVSTNTVTSDFYKYYGIRGEIEVAIEKVTKKFGLDKNFWIKNYNNDIGKSCIKDLFIKISNHLSN